MRGFCYHKGGMPGKVKKTIKRFKMIEPGDVVIAAVSGGPDSVCLLDTLDRIKDELDFTLEVAHLDHGIRGENSRRDAQFVKELAKLRGLKLYKKTATVPQLARKMKMSIEEAAREARYEFFERLLKNRGGSESASLRSPIRDVSKGAVGSRGNKSKVKIALGHTATDQAETVLMRLLRGSGPRGLAAIPPVRGPYIRPLIQIERKEVVAYLNQRGLRWMEDETNVHPGHLRNRLRNELIPTLEKDFNPRLIESLCNTADACRSVEDYLESEAQKIVKAHAVKKGKGFYLLRKAFTESHLAVATVAFELLWRMARGNLDKLGFEHRAKIVDTIREGQSGMFYLPDGWIAAVDSGGITISPKIPIKLAEYRMPLKIPGETIIDSIGMRITAEILSRGPEERWKNADPEEAFLDFDAIAPPIEVRSPRPGDRMKPIGGSGTRKLQDIFTDLKVPRWGRSAIPVITSAGEIAWVAPLKVSHTFRITRKTAKLLHLRISGPISFEQNSIL